MKELIDYQRSRKRELASEIAELLSDFNIETGLCVTYINLDIETRRTVNGEQDLLITNVDLRVEL